MLPILEAKDSSEIENIVTTSDKLFQYADTESAADPTIKEALRYRTALYRGYQQLSKRPLCTNTGIEICSHIKDSNMDIRKVPGTVIANQASGEIIYRPPVGERVIRDLLSNWEQFIHGDDDLDPLIKMAVSHYQFEAIHPFTDGGLRVVFLIFSLNRTVITQLTYLVSQPLYSATQSRLLLFVVRSLHITRM